MQRKVSGKRFFLEHVSKLLANSGPFLDPFWSLPEGHFGGHVGPPFGFISGVVFDTFLLSKCLFEVAAVVRSKFVGVSVAAFDAFVLPRLALRSFLAPALRSSMSFSRFGGATGTPRKRRGNANELPYPFAGPNGAIQRAQRAGREVK